MDRTAIVQFVLDRNMEAVDASSEDFLGAAATVVMEHVRTLVSRTHNVFSLRNALPLCASPLLADAELRSAIERKCHESNRPYNESVLEDAIWYARTRLVEGGIRSSIQFIQDIGGENVRHLLGSLLAAASQEGIERTFYEDIDEETGANPYGGLMERPPGLTNEDYKNTNDVNQILDLLWRDVLRELGLTDESL